MRFIDKVAIVTGASSGIGQATAEVLAEQGAKVVLADIDAQNGESAAEGIRQRGGQARFVEADISREKDAQKITDEALAAFGQVNILVNDAAAFVLKGFGASLEDWQRSLGVNVIGTAMVTRYAIEPMKKTGGAIVLVGSISSFCAQPDFFVYSATKAALVQMTRNMAMDLGPFGIRVNSVCPGTILTPASLRHIKKIGSTVEEFSRTESAKAFLGRVGSPREVALPICFLVSEEASYITGASLMVDAGYSAM
jgi:NAD(P)-dependent dehydrogenase (short-subunit alcohol dehydrogenase family)